jgi:protoporphyrinogen/coproporphyrinogen III oxidase
MKSALVVGAGLSGLAAAWSLSSRGIVVHVVDAGEESGGLIHTRRTANGLVETAANAFVWTERLAALASAIGVELIEASATSRKRYIFRDGRARRWPLGPVESLATLAKAGAAMATRSAKPRGGETVRDWGERVLGRAATTWALAPAMQGVYAAPLDRLSAPVIFGRKRGKIRSVAPRGGMGEFVGRLADALRAKGVTFAPGLRLDAIASDTPTIVATSARVAAALIAPHAPAAAQAFARVEQTSIVTITIFLQPHHDDLRGFGVLFPRATGVQAAGVLFNTDIFPGRSALRSETWIYTGDAAARVPADDAQAIAMRVRPDRAELTRRDAEPISWMVTRRIDALPVYGHAVLEAAEAADALPAWLGVAGNYLGQIGVSALLDRAEAAAARLVTT